MSAREELLNTFAMWFFTTGKGSRGEADRILRLHRKELAEELRAESRKAYGDGPGYSTVRAYAFRDAADMIEEGPPNGHD